MHECGVQEVMGVERGGKVGGLDVLHQNQVHKASHTNSRNSN